MVRRKSAIVCTAAAAAAALAVIILLFAACGHRRSLVTQFPPTAPEQRMQNDTEQPGGVLPPVIALDGCIGAMRSVSEDDKVTSPGWEAYINDQTGTNGDSDLNVEMDGTALTLRAYAPGEFAWALYGQHVGEVPKPLRSLIDSDPCSFGGGQDDDIPLSYFVGIADYSLGSWRWFGPFGDVDVMITVNSETLRSRFKSPGDNFYLCVLASNASKTASALPEDGLVANFPFEPRERAVSEDDDPGGLTIEEICTWVADNLYTEPAVVTGLSLSTTTSGVTISWDKNPDPDVDIYQIFRRDPDTEDPREVIATVFTPDTDLIDSADDPVYPMFNWEVGVPGKEYKYSVRARNDAGYGGYSIVSGIRLMTAPTVTASDGASSDHVHVSWTGVEGAQGYILLRGDTPEETPAELGQFDAGTLSYDDYDCVLEQTYYYWVQALGEDADSPLAGPEPGLTAELEANQVLASDGAYPDRVELIWGEDPGADSYNVYRDTDEDDSEGVEYLGTVDAPQCAFSDDTVPWNEPHYYFVRPYTEGGGEGPRGIGDWGHRGLAAPANVAATQGTFTGKVTVSWSAVSQATRYRVYRSTTSDDPDPAYRGEVSAPAASYDDAASGWSGTEGVHYFYYVAALHDGPDTERSDWGEPIAEGWRGIGIPQDASASDGTNTEGVNISWTSVTGATQYGIYRSVVEDDPGPNLLETVAAPSTGWSDATAEHDTLYWYCVSALYNGDEGELSADDSGYRGLAPPLNVQASDDLGDTIEITWDAVTGATGYIIYRSTTQTGTYTQIDTDNASPYTDGPFTPPISYWYKLKATNSLATSALSAGDEGSACTSEWHISALDNVGGVDYRLSLKVINGNPAIAYCHISDADLKYVRANSSDGSSWGTPLIIDSAGDVGKHPFLAIVNSYPAISYWDSSNYDLKYVRADNASGSAWGTPITIDSEGQVGRYSSLTTANDSPAISYWDYGNRDLKYVRATDANGDSWGVPIIIDSTGYVGVFTSLAIVDGNPAISYFDDGNDDLKYVRANDVDGNTWGTSVSPDSAGSVGQYGCLAIINGKPAISYLAGYDVNEDLRYIRASNADGSSWGTFITVDSIGHVGKWTSLAVVNSYPAISYYDGTNKDLKYVWASDASGSTWGTPVTVDSVGDVGYATSLIEVEGSPAIAYYDATNGNLKFAIYY